MIHFSFTLSDFVFLEFGIFLIFHFFLPFVLPSFVPNLFKLERIPKVVEGEG